MEKTVLITGASSGIGKETAVLFAQNGYRVFACVRKKSDKFRLENTHKNIKGVYLDVTNPSGIDKAFWYVMKFTAKLDAVINCAGIAVAGPMEVLPIKRIKEQFDVNTFGTISVVQKFLPLITNGKIVYVSSMAASGIFPFLAPYCASKKATDIMLNSLMNEFKNKNVKVVSVKPGCIITPFWDKSVANNVPAFESSSDSMKKKYEKEMKFLAENAQKNNYRGTLPLKVAETIFKAVETEKPKLSYTVGNDAFFTMLFAKVFPQTLINKAVRFFLKKRMN
ncbi:MAG: SDR family NAD(P)-dependent oxidoreductase [Candidatus Gastranaerophilaceae bacterium]